jgi:hypothetical protein
MLDQAWLSGMDVDVRMNLLRPLIKDSQGACTYIAVGYGHDDSTDHQEPIRPRNVDLPRENSGCMHELDLRKV